MKIFLVVPPFKLDQLYPGLGKIAPYFPPLELAYIASSLKMQGHDIKILDCPALELDFSELMDIVRNDEPDIAIIPTSSPIYSFVYSLYPPAKELIKLLKKTNPLTKTVLIGFISSVLSENVLLSSGADFVVRGESEITCIELCRAIQDKTKLEAIRGLGFREKGKIIINKERDFIEDLDELPPPAYSLLPLNKYRFISDTPVPVKGITLRASRGCAFNCYFCPSAGFWKQRIRSHSHKYVISTMNYLYENYNINRFQFHDDIFGVPKEWNIEFCTLLVKNKYRFKWDCYSHFRYLDEKVINAMKKAGCHLVSLGIECGSDKMLKEFKGITKHEIEEKLILLKKSKMKMRLFFLIGPPAESEAEIEETIKYAIKLNPDIFAPTIVLPFPGSRFFQDMQPLGFTPDFDTFFSKKACDLPKFKKEDLERMIKKSYRQFYLRPAYIIRILPSLLKNIKNAFVYLYGLRYLLKK